MGRQFKRLVLAVGGREVERGRPTGYPRGAWPMTTSVYEVDFTVARRLVAALQELAGRIRGRS